nr:MAG TPA: hypothetical protein [Bacteriophage sp.]
MKKRVFLFFNFLILFLLYFNGILCHCLFVIVIFLVFLC